MGAGLAPVQANGSSHDAGGLLIAYATDPGAVAYDGNSEHSPYTAALSRNLATPGLEIQSALTRVRAEVSQATKGAQRPWHNASLAREVFIGGLLPAAPADTPPSEPAVARPPADTAAGPGVDWDVERTVWEEASKRNTIEYYEFYLKRYPDGRFAGLADLGLDQLKKAERVPGAEPPSAVPDAETRTADVKPVPTTPLPAAPAPATQSAADQPAVGGDGSGASTAFATAAAAPQAQTPQAKPLPTTPVPATESAIDQARQGEDGPDAETASASPDTKPVVGTEDGTPLPGTPATEAELELDRDGRIDLQLRLSALGLYAGGFDGSLGPRSRAAIGAWQRQNGVVETTYLTTEQHLRIVVQTEPLMAEIRARYLSQKAATRAPEKTKKPVKAATTRPGGKSTKTTPKTAVDNKPPTKTSKVASKNCTTYDVVSQSYEPCKTPTTKPRKKVVSSKLPCTVYDVVSQSYQPCKTATKPKKKVASSKLPCTRYDVVSQSYEPCK
jgi:peptidoglycan hydrolase-like protein with peptidoglycan-binding domain